MTNSKTLGIDLAKTVFQLHGIDERGNRFLSKRLARSKLRDFIANLPPCRIAMEACGSAHYWARKFMSLGHEVKLIAPQFVKPYVKSNKNDAHDAEAIAEAATRPHMRFVPIKQIEHQDMQMLHRVRSQAVKQRTALSNQIRGFLAENGIILPQGFKSIRHQLRTIIESPQHELSPVAQELFTELLEEFHKLDERVDRYDHKIEQAVKQNPICQRLMQVEGVGPLTATILWATIIDPHLFKNGRGVVALLGLVPKQHSSGGRTTLLGISKRGDPYVRTLLIHGARTVIKYATKGKTVRQRWIMEKVARSGVNKTAVAVANKNARILWALMATGEQYRVTC